MLIAISGTVMAPSVALGVTVDDGDSHASLAVSDRRRQVLVTLDALDPNVGGLISSNILLAAGSPAPASTAASAARSAGTAFDSSIAPSAFRYRYRCPVAVSEPGAAAVELDADQRGARLLRQLAIERRGTEHRGTMDVRGDAVGRREDVIERGSRHGARVADVGSRSPSRSSCARPHRSPAWRA